MWRSFDVVNLSHNHRQGENKDFADLLNRVRTGEQSEEDLETLGSRVRQEGDPELADCVRINATVKEVVAYNEEKLDTLPGKLYNIMSINFTKTQTNYKPPIDKAGRIGDTQFQYILSLKVGSRVMLIYNIGIYLVFSLINRNACSLIISTVSDGLCNGAMGELIAVEEHQDGTVNKLVIKFDNPSTGSTTRENYTAYKKKYPGGTVIGLKEIEYSLARSKSLISSTAKLIQYPLIAAFAITGKLPLNKVSYLECIHNFEHFK